MRRWIFHHGAVYLSWFYCILWLYTSVQFVIMFEPFHRYLLCKYCMQIYAINFSDKDCFKSSALYYLLLSKKIWQLRLYHVLVFIVFQKISGHPPVYITWLDWKLPEGRNCCLCLWVLNTMTSCCWPASTSGEVLPCVVGETQMGEHSWVWAGKNSPTVLMSVDKEGMFIKAGVVVNGSR